MLTVSDIIDMQKHIANMVNIDKDIIDDVADLNKDGILSVADVLMAQNILAKKQPQPVKRQQKRTAFAVLLFYKIKAPGDTRPNIFESA